MCIRDRPKRGFRFASLSLLFSLLGAVVGYLLGHYAYELVKPALAALGWLDKIDAVSYTHLDVYKRQAWWWAVRSSFRTCGGRWIFLTNWSRAKPLRQTRMTTAEPLPPYAAARYLS